MDFTLPDVFSGAAQTPIQEVGSMAAKGAADTAQGGFFENLFSRENLLNFSTGALTGLKALGEIQAGRSQAQALEFQAKQQELEAKNALLNAKAETNTIQKRLLEDLASQNAMFAARGILVTSGSAQAAATRATENATLDIETARFGGRIRNIQSRGRASILRAQSDDAKIGGFLKAAGTVGSGFL